MRLLAIFFALALTLLPATAPAWNARGHMTVAGIAWENMTPRARMRAIALLRLNPDFGSWAHGFTGGEQDRIAFMEAATWPDDLRGRVCGNPPRPGCITDDGYTPTDATADVNIGYRDHRLRRYWHFKDIGFSRDGTHVDAAFHVNAETQILAFSESLSNSTLSDEVKSFNLTWLLHLVGDVHQPLHATARFSAATPDGDGGGNAVKLCNPLPAYCNRRDPPSNLHSFWDGAIGTSDSPRSARDKADSLLNQLRDTHGFLAMRVARTNLNAPVASWLTESAALAESDAYMAPIGPRRGPYTPTPAYRTNAGSIAEQRIVIAGLRLANMLNAQLGN